MTSAPPPPPMPPATPKKGLSGGAIAGIIIGIVVAVVIVCGGAVAIMLPALGEARQAARLVHSGSNMRGISMALMNYSIENKDAMPEMGADLETRLAPYGVAPGMFTAAEAPAHGPSYYYVPIGRVSDVRYPASTVILYESPDMPNRKSWNVAYVDGSVRVLKEAEYRQAIDSITLPDGTPYAPHKR